MAAGVGGLDLGAIEDSSARWGAAGLMIEEIKFRVKIIKDYIGSHSGYVLLGLRVMGIGSNWVLGSWVWG
mgnify:CR=1 FL=1